MLALPIFTGSEPTAAGGRRKEASEWPRSIADEAAPPARKISGTANGKVDSHVPIKKTSLPK